MYARDAAGEDAASMRATNASWGTRQLDPRQSWYETLLLLDHPNGSHALQCSMQGSWSFRIDQLSTKVYGSTEMYSYFVSTMRVMYGLLRASLGVERAGKLAFCFRSQHNDRLEM